MKSLWMLAAGVLGLAACGGGEAPAATTSAGPSGSRFDRVSTTARNDAATPPARAASTPLAPVSAGPAAPPVPARLPARSEVFLQLQVDHAVASHLESRAVRGRGYEPVRIILGSSHVGHETPLDASVPYCESERRCVFRGPSGPANADGYVLTIPADVPAALTAAGHTVFLQPHALQFERRTPVTVTLVRPGLAPSTATVAFLGADS